MASEAACGQTALQASDYPLAIKHLTAALKVSESPLWLIQRSTAYQRSSQHELALADADNAVLAAIKRAKRELIATAHFRRAVALHALGRYGDARMCLNWCNKINEKEKGLTIWIAKVKKDYETAGGEEAECNQVTVKEVPDKVENVGVAEEVEEKPKDKGKGKAKEVEKIADAAVQKPIQTPREKIRHDWYQSSNSVTIDLLASGVPKDEVEVKFGERSVELSFPILGSASTFDFTLSPLYYAINASKSSYRVTPKKIEITLSKATAGQKWGALEWTAGHPTEPTPPNLTFSPDTSTQIPDAILSPDTSSSLPPPSTNTVTQEKAPSYPTSSRKGPKDWDSIGAGDDDKSDDEGDPNRFFKMLYKGADDDTKKAMMKSYQESGGTSLSTVWSDVKSKTFKPEPPEGMEAKKWET